MAENILHLLRPDSKYTELEAKILDIALILHMEHGGGNNSSFTTHVVSSSMTDTYSVIAAAIGSLKGPRHGGANIKVVQMFNDMMQQVHDWKDEDEVAYYLRRLLHNEAFDQAGRIRTPDVQRGKHQRRLLFRLCISNVRSSYGALHSYLCHC